MIVAVVVAFVAFGSVLAWLLNFLGGMDVTTALLSTAPGGIAQMGVFSVEAKADVPVVLAIHVLQVTSVIVLLSFGLRLLGGRG